MSPCRFYGRRLLLTICFLLVHSSQEVISSLPTTPPNHFSFKLLSLQKLHRIDSMLFIWVCSRQPRLILQNLIRIRAAWFYVAGLLLSCSYTITITLCRVHRLKLQVFYKFSRGQKRGIKNCTVYAAGSLIEVKILKLMVLCLLQVKHFTIAF